MSLRLGLGLAISGGGSAAATPISLLTDVCMWCRSDNGLSVSSWTDQTGKGNTPVQATALLQPTINAADANFNGRPSLQFNGTSQFMSMASFARGTGGDLFIWMVMRMLTAGVFPMFWSEGTSGHEFRGNSGTGAPMMVDATNGVTNAVWGASTVGTTKAISAYVRATRTIVGVNVSNGSAIEAARTTGAMTQPVPICIGARPPTASPTLFANFSVGEIVVSSTMPSSAQLTALQTYATGRYGAV